MSFLKHSTNKNNDDIDYKNEYENCLKSYEEEKNKNKKITKQVKKLKKSNANLKKRFKKLQKENMDLKLLVPHDAARIYLYKRATGKDLNLENPKDFNEKINWLILNRYGPREAKFSDKHLVKQIVEDMNIDNLHIIKTYKIYNDADEIDIDELPEKFVLKCNHFSGRVFICRDKSTFDLNKAKIILNKQMSRSFSYNCFEYHYDYIEPCIIAEELLEDSQNEVLIDYKFYCFDGKTEDLLVCTGRNIDLKLDDYDINWNKREFSYDEYMSEDKLKKPKNFEKMVEIAEKLSENHTFVRIDLYNIDGKIYFGEYTFTPGAGIITHYKQEALDYLGSKINLSP